MAERAGVVQVDVEPGLQGVGSKIDGYMRALKPFGFKADLVSNIGKDLDRESKSGQRSLDSITTKKAQGELTQLGDIGERELGRIGSKAGLTGGQMAILGGGAVAVGSKILSSLRPSVDAASDLNEVVSYSNQVFGDSAAAINKWAESSVGKLAQSRREAIAGATDFATFGKAAGLAGNDLVGFSTDLVQLAADLASARNTSPEEAITAISAALRGETEPIRQYGVLLDDATLRQEAFALGLTKTTKDALTPQQRVLAAQSAIFKQTSDAQGDLARTGNSLANVERKKKAAAEDAAAAFGKGLAPALAAVQKVGGEALGVLNEIPGATEGLGLAVAGLGVTSILGGVVTSLLGARKALQEFRAERAATAAENVATEAPAVAATTGTAAAAAESAAATETVARAMDDVTAASGRAGTAGTAAMSGIATTAGVATGAVTTAATALGTLGSVNLAGVGSEVSAIASGIKALPARAGVIDVASWEVLGELGPGTARVVTDVGTAAENTVGPLGRMSGAIGSGVTSIRGAIGAVPPLTAGLAAGTVAVIGFSSAWSQLKSQTDTGVGIFSIKPDEIQAAFDPEKPERFLSVMTELQRGIGQLDAVGEFTAFDKLNPFFDDSGNRAKVAAADIESLKTALTLVSTSQARQALDFLAPTLRKYEAEGKLAKGTTKELYDQIGRRESIDRGRAGIKQLGDDVDRFGFIIDRTKGKYEQYIDTINNVTDAPDAAVSATKARLQANKDVAEAEAEVARLRAGGTKSAEDAAAAERDLADAARSVAAARRDQAAAQRELENANRDLQHLQDELAHIDPARDPNRYRDLTEQVRDAQDKQADARDRVANAADSIKSAEERVTETRSKQISTTDDLAAAEKNLSDARDRQKQADKDEQAALATLNDTLAAHPEMLQATFDAIDEYGRRNGLAADEVARLKAETLLALQAAKDQKAWIDANPIPVQSGKDTADKEHQAQRPIGPPASAKTLSVGLQQGVDLRLVESYYEYATLPDGTVRKGSDNRKWTFHRKGESWTAQFHDGGLVGPEGGEVHEGEVVLNKAAVRRLGAGNLLALNDGADLPAVAARSSAPAAIGTGATPARVSSGGATMDDIVAALLGLHAIVSNLQHITYAPQFHGVKPDQIGDSMDEAFRGAQRHAWPTHGALISRG